MCGVVPSAKDREVFIYPAFLLWTQIRDGQFWINSEYITECHSFLNDLASIYCGIVRKAAISQARNRYFLLVWEPPTVKWMLPNLRSPWQLQLPLGRAATSDKRIKMVSSGIAATLMVTLTSRQQHSNESTLPTIASSHQASHCSRSFRGPTAIASIG
jgi:hypothetical protein